MLLVGAMPAVRESLRSLRDADARRFPSMVALTLAVVALALTVGPVRAGGPVRTILVAVGLLLLGSVSWAAAGLLRLGAGARWLIARLTPAHVMVIGADQAASRHWYLLHYAGLLAAVAAPYWTLTIAGSIVAVIAFEIIERQRGVLRRLSRSWLAVPPLLAAWWLVAAVSGPGHQTIASLADAPFSPPAEIALAGLIGFAAAALLRPGPLHVSTSRSMLGLVAAALVLKVALRAAPLGMIYWQPVAFLIAVIAGWAAVVTKQVRSFVIALTFAALWSGTDAMPGAVLLALLQPVAPPLPSRAAVAAGAIAMALVAGSMLDAEAVFTVLLAGAGTALLASLAEVAPPR
jgi:hypothetical protein